MPSIEDYTLFLNGIIQTAQDKIDYNGKIEEKDVLILYKIAKFKDGKINEEAAADLTTVYTTHYHKMTANAIASLEMFIITHAINAYLWKYKGEWSEWYVGITNDEDIDSQLFVKHKVKEEGGMWIYRTVTASSTAHAILDYYKKNGAQGGVHGTGNTVRKVYAFKLAKPASKPNPFSKVSLTQNPINPNRKVHDLDPQNYRQCPSCYGSGRTTCSSCGGSGGRSESRVDYDWNNNPIYRTEWVACYSCSGGQSTCSRCGGSGTVNK
ncbi:MAG: hypothetical protein R3E32_15940 [Chitinophagales bacterium]